uniref:Pco103361 n=1 Tax=Arundo donax TaxID=35708 RepID=A0A0A9ENZ0_ARUDO
MMFTGSSILKDTWKVSFQGNILIVQSNSLVSQSSQSITWLTSLKYLMLRTCGMLIGN